MRPRVAITICGLLCAGAASADVRLVRSVDGRTTIFNQVGSGWTVGGKVPSDAYLVARRAEPTKWDELIHEVSRARGVDPSFVKSVVLVESNFNHRAVSRKGAGGLMQLMPATASRYGVRDRFDPRQNVHGGVAYLADLLELFAGDLSLTLAAYNAGENAVARYGGIPPYRETQEYVRRALVAYGGAGSGRGALGGGFRGQPVKPASKASARVTLDSKSRVLSNAGPVARTAPLLGRVAPGASEAQP